MGYAHDIATAEHASPSVVFKYTIDKLEHQNKLSVHHRSEKREHRPKGKASKQ